MRTRYHFLNSKVFIQYGIIHAVITHYITSKNISWLINTTFLVGPEQI